jgi:hypothetical protein
MMRRDGDVHVFGPVVVVESNVKMMLAHSVLAYMPCTSRGRDEFNVYSSDLWRSGTSGWHQSCSVASTDIDSHAHWEFYNDGLAVVIAIRFVKQRACHWSNIPQ